MNRIIQSALVLLTVSGMVTLADAASRFSCGDGWIPFKDKCYAFSAAGDEQDIFSIKTTCDSRDATMVHPSSDEELNFLYSQAQRLHVYGWMTGYKVFKLTVGNKKIYRVSDEKGTFSKSQVQLPKPNVDPSGSLDCIAYRPGYFSGYDDFGPGMTTVDCNIKLPYVCRGDISKVSSSDLNLGKHWIKNGTQDVFWVSDSTNKLNYSSAQKSCESKGMALFSIRNKITLAFIDESLKERSANKFEPWWTGLRSTGSLTFSWIDNVPMDGSVITWMAPAKESLRFLHIVLLGSGNALYMPNQNYNQLFPYICVKNATISSKYSCPQGWTRGGRSCYRSILAYLMTWDKADQFCATTGAHLLTIDSKDELTWLRDSNMIRPYSYSTGGMWTSLNNKKSKNFVWSDGSRLNTSIVRWVKPLDENVGEFKYFSGHCIVLSNGYIYADPCNSRAVYGCQYQTSNGNCYDDKWSFYKGYCYLTRFPVETHAMFNTGKAMCRTLVAGSDIVPDLVKIQTLDTLKFLNKSYAGMNVRIGLNSQIKPGTWTWADGTKADMSIFPVITQPDTGKGKNCVAVTFLGNLYTADCDDKNYFLCEKEIKMGKQGSQKGSQPGQAANYKPRNWMVFLIVFIAVLKIAI